MAWGWTVALVAYSALVFVGAVVVAIRERQHHRVVKRQKREIDGCAEVITKLVNKL